MAMKKKWEKPVLIVLSRGKPEECVLLSCKMTDKTYGPAAITTAYRYCRFPNNAGCGPCSGDSIS